MENVKSSNLAPLLQSSNLLLITPLLASARALWVHFPIEIVNLLLLQNEYLINIRLHFLIKKKTMKEKDAAEMQKQIEQAEQRYLGDIQDLLKPSEVYKEKAFRESLLHILATILFVRSVNPPATKAVNTALERLMEVNARCMVGEMKVEEV